MTRQTHCRSAGQRREAVLLCCALGLFIPASYSQSAEAPRPALTTAAQATSAERVSSSVREAAVRARLDPAKVERGDTVAVVDGRRQVLTPSNLAQLAASDAVLVERVRSQAVATKPSGTLLTALESARPVATMKLGYELSAKKADNTRARVTVFAADKTGLLFDFGRRAYVGTFMVALDSSDLPGDSSALAHPIDIGVRAPGASMIAPVPVRIARLAEWTDVEVEVPDPRASTFPVSVSARPGDEGDSLELAVMRPRFNLSAANTSVLGWGLGTTVITVSSRGMRSYEGFTVPLTATAGALEPSMVRLDRDGWGKAVLRSDTSQSTVIRAGDPDSAAEALTVSFRAPTVFIAFAIAGGLLGAFLRGKGRRKWPAALAIGIGTAVLMTVGQAVGFTRWIATILRADNLANSGEAVVFFVGAAAALLGVTALIHGPARGKGKD